MRRADYAGLPADATAAAILPCTTNPRPEPPATAALPTPGAGRRFSPWLCVRGPEQVRGLPHPPRSSGRARRCAPGTSCRNQNGLPTRRVPWVQECAQNTQPGLPRPGRVSTASSPPRRASWPQAFQSPCLPPFGPSLLTRFLFRKDSLRAQWDEPFHLLERARRVLLQVFILSSTPSPESLSHPVTQSPGTAPRPGR